MAHQDQQVKMVAMEMQEQMDSQAHEDPLELKDQKEKLD
jgi:hypothetical protein